MCEYDLLQPTGEVYETKHTFSSTEMKIEKFLESSNQ
jgi:hypothetical protein